MELEFQTTLSIFLISSQQVIKLMQLIMLIYFKFSSKNKNVNNFF